MFAALLILIRGYTVASHRILVIGWANRLLIVLCCVSALTVAIEALKRRRP
jgi:hypothetical protein